MFKRTIFFLIPLLLLSATDSHAVPLIDVGLTGGDGEIALEYSGGVAGVLSTVDDGNALSMGEQDFSSINFRDGLAILNGTIPDGSFTLDGVTRNGDAVDLIGITSQDTTGGTFSLWDNNNTLLISGDIQEGSISSLNANFGFFVNTNNVTFTGGTLVNTFINASPGGITFVLSNIQDALGNPGLSIANLPGGGTGLDVFTAASSVVIDGVEFTNIPEPGTALLLVSGLLLGGARRRKK